MIKMLVMDVDGTLTDGKIYMGDDREQFKAFNIKDGYGIKELLPRYGIIPVIITGRKSLITQTRANELNISELYQGESNKREVLLRLIGKYNISMDEVAYIGDDIPDLECMKNCGLTGCPNDSVKEIKEISNFVSEHNGGEGAVRDFIDYLIERNSVLTISNNKG